VEREGEREREQNIKGVRVRELDKNENGVGHKRPLGGMDT
jgi:hypothetical protein